MALIATRVQILFVFLFSCEAFSGDPLGLDDPSESASSDDKPSLVAGNMRINVDDDAEVFTTYYKSWQGTAPSCNSPACPAGWKTATLQKKEVSPWKNKADFGAKCLSGKKRLCSLIDCSGDLYEPEDSARKNCQYATFQAGEGVMCGNRGCLGASFTSTSSAFCTHSQYGWWGCQEASFYDTSVAYCDSGVLSNLWTGSCNKASFYDNAVANCAEEASCNSASFYGNSRAVCTAVESCKYANFYGDACCEGAHCPSGSNQC